MLSHVADNSVRNISRTGSWLQWPINVLLQLVRLIEVFNKSDFAVLFVAIILVATDLIAA